MHPFSEVPYIDEPYYARIMLVRVNDGFTHMAVDKVCKLHNDGEHVNHVLRIPKGDLFLTYFQKVTYIQSVLIYDK